MRNFLRKNINYLELSKPIEGKERQLDILKEVLNNGTFLPQTVLYKDMDQAFKDWVEGELKIVGEDGKEYPTMTLYSNQRFSEYAQSWKYTDNNNNLILNFKTVNRENNPQYGKIQSGAFNIPGEHFFLMKRKKVLDDNGSESFLELKMKQPMAIDLNYILTIFTTKYEDINNFNILINKKFEARQSYIQPNGYYMPMILDAISDKSQYNIDDRQFYSQSYNIHLMGFVITEDDFKVEETPLKQSVNFSGLKNIKKPEVEIEECEPKSPYYYKPIILSIKFPICKKNEVKFTIDTNFTCENIELTNILNNFKIFINGDEISEKDKQFQMKDGDEIKILIKKRILDEEASMVMNGFDKTTIYDENLDNPEFEEDNKQITDFYDIE